jgi:hypothetical protein
MALDTGTRLGPYEVVAKLGEGGMGEIYRALDARLDRTVALKVSKEEFTDRFEREARAVAALNHPNICTLHDVGPNYLVMELVEGVPLSGPLPVEKAVEYAGQILDALEAAHRQGITHRDLKPANILVTKQGIKLLDFGLATQASGPLADQGLTVEALTTQGQIVGTLQYMAPEQLQSQPADARSDIFAFGCVLYEMLSGKRAFEGASPASVIAAILEREPAPLELHAPLDRVIATCLDKDPDARFQNARDLKRALTWAMEPASTEGVPAPRSRLLPGALAAAALIMAAAAGYFALRPAPTPPPALVRLDVVPPPGQEFWSVFAVSPDGRTLAFSARTGPGDEGMIWLRSLSAGSAYPLAGTEGGLGPFWSPTGDELGFRVAGQIKKVPVSGGPAQLIGDFGSLHNTWNRDGVILVSQGGSGCDECDLHQLPATGGTATPANTRDSDTSQRRWASFLPNGRHYLFTLVGATEERGTYIGELGTDAKTLLVEDVSNAQYAGGHVFYVKDETLLAQAFDVETLQTTADPIPVFENIVFTVGPGRGAFAVSETTIVARAKSVQPLRQLTWMDRSGATLGALGEPGDLSRPDIAPDGTRVAVIYRTQTGGTQELWAWDLERQVFAQLRPGEAVGARYSSDGTRIAFGSPDGVRVMAAGGGAEQVLVPPASGPGPSSGYIEVDDWSADDGYIAFDRPFLRPSGLADLQSGSAAPAAGRIVQLQFSPDGGWMAYVGNSGGGSVVFVEPFDGTPASGAGRVQVSTERGRAPRWRADGRELYYISGTDQLMAVSVTPGPTLTLGTPTPLFAVPAGADYDVTADGQRFIVTVPVGDAITPPLSVLLNWRGMLPG